MFLTENTSSSLINISFKSPHLIDSKEDRVSRYQQMNVSVVWDKLSDGDFLTNKDAQVVRTLDQLRSNGFTPFSENYLLHTVGYFIEKDGLQIPFGGEFKRTSELNNNPQLRSSITKERSKFFDLVANKFKVSLVNGQIVVLDQEGKDVTEEIKKTAEDRKELVDDLSGYDSFSGKATRLAKNFCKENKGLAIFLTNSRPDSSAPLVSIDSLASSTNLGTIKKNADSVVTETKNPVFYVLRESVLYQRLRAQHARLARAVKNGEIEVQPTFNKNNWPTHPLLEHLKGVVEPSVRKFIEDNGLTCDPLDAQYQVMFGLTRFKVEQLFAHNDKILDIFRRAQEGSNWQDITKVDLALLKDISVDAEILTQEIQSQLRLIQHRLSQSDLPVADIVTPSGIFAQEGWEVKKQNGDVMVIRRDKDKTVVDTRAVDFRAIDPALATKYHRDLHYIHTPRSGQAFGFFLEDEDLPFSVLAVEPVDRVYKQNALLLFGYDPRYCIDFTRLYSRPGVPKNASSAIFGETFSYLRQEDPRLEAAISAFMPSYATGLSMLTGGFKDPILAKPGIHYFENRTYPFGEVAEHLTKRRQSGGEIIRSQLPLLPVIELISPLKEPRFEPVLQVGQEMVVTK